MTNEQIDSQYHLLGLAPCLGLPQSPAHQHHHHHKHQQEVRQELYLQQARTEHHSIRLLASLYARLILEEAQRDSTPSVPFPLTTPSQTRRLPHVHLRVRTSARDPKSRASNHEMISLSSQRRNIRITMTMSSPFEDHQSQATVRPKASNLLQGERRAGIFYERCHWVERRQLEVGRMSLYQK
jgi:hypothetical protein